MTTISRHDHDISTTTTSITTTTITTTTSPTEVPNYLWHMWPTKELNGYIIYSEPKIVAYESCNEVPRSKYIMRLKSNDVNGYNRIFPGEKIRDYYDLRSL